MLKKKKNILTFSVELNETGKLIDTATQNLMHVLWE